MVIARMAFHFPKQTHLIPSTRTSIKTPLTHQFGHCGGLSSQKVAKVKKLAYQSRCEERAKMQDASHPFQSSSMDDQHDMPAPPTAVYHSLEELLTGSNHFAASNGYKLVVVRSKTNAAGQKTWVHLACDRHGERDSRSGSCFDPD